MHARSVSLPRIAWGHCWWIRAIIKAKANATSIMFCGKTCLVGLLIRSIFAGKNARALQRECSISSEKSNELADQQDMFCFNHASTFYTSNSTVKMLIDNKFKAQTLIGHSTGNYRCQLLASCALNMSCSFNQSGRSIESRCVVIFITRCSGACLIKMIKTTTLKHYAIKFKCEPFI